jgi:hypothetical protein
VAPDSAGLIVQEGSGAPRRWCTRPSETATAILSEPIIVDGLIRADDLFSSPTQLGIDLGLRIHCGVCRLLLL